MGDDQREEVSVSGLGAEIVPVFRTHSQRAQFAEAWHALQGEGDDRGDLEDEDVCDLVGKWEGWVRVRGVQTCDLLHCTSRVTGIGGALRTASQGSTSFSGACECGNLADPGLRLFRSGPRTSLGQWVERHIRP